MNQSKIWLSVLALTGLTMLSPNLSALGDGNDGMMVHATPDGVGTVLQKTPQGHAVLVKADGSNAVVIPDHNGLVGGLQVGDRVGYINGSMDAQAIPISKMPAKTLSDDDQAKGLKTGVVAKVTPGKTAVIFNPDGTGSGVLSSDINTHNLQPGDVVLYKDHALSTPNTPLAKIVRKS